MGVFAPRILVCNDDGIESPGLQAAVRALLGLGEVIVAAPARQQTGSGRSYSFRPDAVLERVEFTAAGQSVEAYRLDGSPAMIVQHAVPVLFGGRPPALVVSGINYGENVGTSITTSGTVGAALEAARFGLPALAVSRQTALGHYFEYGALDWTAAGHFTRHFAAKLLEGRLPHDADVLSVNVPSSAAADTPWRLTRVSRQPYYCFGPASPSADSRLGDGVLRIDIDGPTLEPDSDIHALSRDRVVSVTPLSLDLTARTDLGRLGERLLG